MEVTGKISPDSSTCGSMIMNASWMAWPWFCETVEIRTPIPSVTSRNRAAPRAKVATLPVNGTPNRPIPISTIAVRSTAATIRYGAILPAITSLARSGITASCSSVPVCRSLTTPRCGQPRGPDARGQLSQGALGSLHREQLRPVHQHVHAGATGDHRDDRLAVLQLGPGGRLAGGRRHVCHVERRPERRGGLACAGGQHDGRGVLGGGGRG